ncbi:MAG: ADP-forming succinate--CoA ligase subunit beta [Candidatus Brocadiae bacterium]|nr:ADP-forming succinate--CoA ligase subunit beta [Candidatus Brocadiia bacterium]
MNVHEYQAKELLRRYGIAVPDGRVASTAVEAEGIFGALNAPVVAVKAQIHAGGRGKAGGIKLATSPAESRAAAEGILGKTLVTHQTGPAGRLVRKVWVEAGTRPEREFYVGIVIDREAQRPVLMVSPAGGMDIEEVAAKTPGKIFREVIGSWGLQPFQVRKIARALGLDAALAKQAQPLLASLCRLFVELDCSMVEINPLAVAGGRLIALDAKLNFDDRALFRHPEIEAMRDEHEEDPAEREAAKIGISYISLDGNIGCMVNGAGLAMSTMDVIKLHGGAPANFLDVGGGATKEQVTAAFRLLLGNANVKAILVNIFGGIMKCDIIANGVIAAARELKMTVPVVVRLEGTNVELGRKLLGESGLALTTATDMDDAAKKIVAAAAGR